MVERLLARLAEEEAVASTVHAAVLADVATKRQILDQHRQGTYTNVSLGIRGVAVCTTCHAVMDSPDGWDDDEDGEWSYPLVQRKWPCPTVRLLAQ